MVDPTVNLIHKDYDIAYENGRFREEYVPGPEGVAQYLVPVPLCYYHGGWYVACHNSIFNAGYLYLQRE